MSICRTFDFLRYYIGVDVSDVGTLKVKAEVALIAQERDNCRLLRARCDFPSENVRKLGTICCLVVAVIVSRVKVQRQRFEDKRLLPRRAAQILREREL